MGKSNNQITLLKMKIYFICPSNKFPTGGVKQIYKQVDILNNNGFEAYVLLKNKSKKVTWFENHSQTAYNEQIFFNIKKLLNPKKKYLFETFKNKFRVQIEENSILVFPEIYGKTIEFIAPKNKKVIFNQNCFYTFNTSLIDDVLTKTNQYTNPKTLATIVVSDDSKKYLDFAFTNSINIFRIRLGINNNLFYHNLNKKKKIAFMPRKLEDDIVQILNILKIRNKINDWEFISINNKTETEVAAILRESSIFLSFNHREGFGLPPAEAMACGCIVVGYTGIGGAEYFKNEFSYSIDESDIIGFAKTIENVVALQDDNIYKFNKQALLASKYITETYSLENEKQDILTTWNAIFTLVEQK